MGVASWPRATLRGKPEVAILNLVFNQGPRHLGSSYGKEGQNCFQRFLGENGRSAYAFSVVVTTVRKSRAPRLNRSELFPPTSTPSIAPQRSLVL